MSKQETKCAKCNKLIQEAVTGKFESAQGALCRSCFFVLVGQEFDHHPVMAPKKLLTAQ